MTTTSNAPTPLGDYVVIRLQTQLKIHHYIYIRPHNPKEPDPDSFRSLFIVNVPVDSTEEHFRSLFSTQLLGGARVERVGFASSRPVKRTAGGLEASFGKNKKRKRESSDNSLGVAELPETWNRVIQRSGSSVAVVFVDRPSMDAAWKAIQRAHKSSTVAVWGERTEGRVSPLGSKRYLAHHVLRYPGSEGLQSTVDNYMTTFSALEVARARNLARARAIPDADGFITVTRGGRVGPARLDEANEAMEKQKVKEQARKQGMDDFYRFQVREKNKERAGELVRAFEEDRKKVEEMRKARRATFKPM